MAVADYKAKRQARERRERRQKPKRREKQKRGRGPLAPYDRAKDFDPHGLRWRFSVVRQKGGKKGSTQMRIDKWLETASWIDEGPILTGSITVRRMPEDRGKLQDGDVVRCQVFYGGAWRELWRMRIWRPSDAVGEDQATFDLADDMRLLQQSKDDFKFKRRDSDKKEGWLCHEILLEVCRRYGVRPGKVAKGKYRIKNLAMQDVSPVDVINRAYALERRDSGKEFVLHWRDGKLHMTRLRESKVLYTLRRQITSAVVTRDRGEDFHTAATVMGGRNRKQGGDGEGGGGGGGGGGNGDKGKEREALKIRLRNGKAVRRYGYIHRPIKVKAEVDTRQELLRHGQRELAKNIARHTQNQISLTHIGIPFVRRGEALRIRLPEYGFHDTKRQPLRAYQGEFESVLYVTAASHSLSAGDYSLDLDFAIRNPKALEAEEIRKARDRKRRKAKREKRKAEKQRREKAEKKEKEEVPA